VKKNARPVQPIGSREFFTKIIVKKFTKKLRS
jgi:hypothetical protein